MKLLRNLALTLGAAAGAAAYLNKKGYLNVKNEKTEDGGNSFTLSLDLPKAGSGMTFNVVTPAREDECECDDECCCDECCCEEESAEGEDEDPEPTFGELAETFGEAAKDAAEELSRDISSMLDGMKNNPEGQF